MGLLYWGHARQHVRHARRRQEPDQHITESRIIE